MKIVQYESLETLLAAHFQTTVEDLRQSQHGGMTEDGREIEFTFEEMCENITIGGCYGFADQKNQEVHVWISKENPPAFETLLSLMSHEVAHNTGKQCEDDIEEEKRAEMFSDVAVKAYSMCKELLS